MMATTFSKQNAKVAKQDIGKQQLVSSTSSSSGASSLKNNGTRVTPKNAYRFVAGSTATFQAIFTDNDKPVKVDTGTTPTAQIYQNGNPIAIVDGQLTPGQTYEYSFDWEIPQDVDVLGRFWVVYQGFFGGLDLIWGDEEFEINRTPSNIKFKTPAYATVDELRRTHPYIDSYLPPDLSKDREARDSLLHSFLSDSSKELNGQLHLRDFHSVYNDNFNLYTRYHAVWSILITAPSQDGSAVSEKVLGMWEKKWRHVLKQIKMHSQLSSIPAGRG